MLNNKLSVESSDRDVSSLKIYKEGIGVLKLEDSLNEKTRNRVIQFCSAIMDRVISDPSYHTRTRSGFIAYNSEQNELSVYLRYHSRSTGRSSNENYLEVKKHKKNIKEQNLSLLFKEGDFK